MTRLTPKGKTDILVRGATYGDVLNVHKHPGVSHLVERTVGPGPNPAGGYRMMMECRNTRDRDQAIDAFSVDVQIDIETRRMLG